MSIWWYGVRTQYIIYNTWIQIHVNTVARIFQFGRSSVGLIESLRNRETMPTRDLDLTH